MHIALFNVKYSANLGDGLLSECLEAELKRAAPATTVTCLDLAGRADYGDGGRFRAIALTCLHFSPAFARRTVVETVLSRSLRRRMRPQWGHALRDVDAVVVGGGNLFGDADLNLSAQSRCHFGGHACRSATR